MLQNDDVMVINQDCKIASDQETTPELFPVSAETSKQRYHQLVELFPDAVMILHDELCTYVNEAAMALFRAEDRNELLNKPLLGMVQTSEWEAFHQRVLRIQLEGGVFRSEERLLRLDGTLADIEIAITTFRDEQGQQALQVAAHDITERKRTQEQVHFLAYYDQLTNLPNRMQLYERLKCLFNECAEKCSSVALLVLDIHNLHEINTVYGDHIGDLVLEEVAARLVANCRSCDVISRYGNDEFIIALPDVELDDAVSIAKNMCGEIAQPFEVEQLELLVSCHQGLAIWHAGDDFESESFVQQAILALHEAKTHDNWLSIFNSRMADTLSQRRTIEYNLHQALDHTKQLLIYFQPQMHLCTRELIGIEALVRWRHPEWGLVTPGQFIPIAEQTGLIEKLDDFVMRSATRLNHQCVASDGRPLRVACNLSVRQFRRPDLVEVVRDVVATSAEQVALNRITPDLLEEGQLFWCLDTLGQHPHF
ncbi:MAG TPA: diguanylate cyclase [Armatimonadota bacterium]|nr:diguanylate cyclase [Armatimonadota bacterium]